MVILYNNARNKLGRLGHQLSQYVTLLAYALRYGEKFYYGDFYERYADLFDHRVFERYSPGEKTVRITALTGIHKLLNRFFSGKKKLGNNIFYCYSPHQGFRVFSDTLREMFSEKNAYVVTERMFNDVEILIEERQRIRDAMPFEKALETKVYGFIETLRKSHDHILALHIRKGEDYRLFDGGKYYFTEKDFVKLAERFFEISGFDRQKTAVVVCSDEPVDVSVFGSLHVFYEPRSFMEDFVLLSKSDYIIAVRSIFSTMANFFGDGRIYQFMDANASFTLDDFLQSESLLSRYNYEANAEKPLEWNAEKLDADHVWKNLKGTKPKKV